MGKSVGASATGKVAHYPIPLGIYRNQQRHPSFDADEHAEAILEVIRGLLQGAATHWAVLGADRDRAQVDARLGILAGDVKMPTTIVWVGHGESNGQDAKLIVPGAATSSDDPKLRPDDFADYLADQSMRRAHLEPRPWTLCIIEACGAGRFVEMVASALHERGGVRGVALIGVGDPQGYGHAGTAAGVLREALGSFDANDTRITVGRLLDAVDERLDDGQLGLAVDCQARRHVIERPQPEVAIRVDLSPALRRPWRITSKPGLMSPSVNDGMLTIGIAAHPVSGSGFLDEVLIGNDDYLFKAFVEQLAKDKPPVAVLLEALAHAQGEGVPRIRVWTAVAGAISKKPPTPRDIDETLRIASPFLVISQEQGQAVYRLAHHAFVKHFARKNTKKRRTAVAEALIELADDTREDLDPYLKLHLVDHVERAGDAGWELLAHHPLLLDVIELDDAARESLRR